MMAVLIALLAVGLAGFVAYTYLRATGVRTTAEERIALVFGVAFALLLRAETAPEFVAELVALSGVVLGAASIAHLVSVAVRDGHAAGQSR